MKLKELYRNDHIIVYTDKNWDDIYFWNIDLEHFVEPAVCDFRNSSGIPRMWTRQTIKKIISIISENAKGSMNAEEK